MSEDKIIDISHIVNKEEPIKLRVEDIDKEAKLVEIDILRERLESDKQDRNERKKYAMYIFWFLCSFLGITLAIVTLTAFKVCHLGDTILVTLLTTTSADIIGVFIIVVKYLFKASKN